MPINSLLPEEDKSINLVGDLPDYLPEEESKPQAERAANESALFNLTLSDSTDIASDFSRVRDNINTTGSDPSLEDTKQDLARTNNQIYAEQVVDAVTNSDLTVDQKGAVLKQAKVEIENKSAVNLREEYQFKEAAGNVQVDPEAEEVHQNLIGSIPEMYNTDREIQNLVRREVFATLQAGSTPQAIVDLFAGSLPLIDAQTYRQIIKDVFDQDTDLTFLFAGGDALRFIKDKLAFELDPQKKIQMAKDLLEAINKHSGVLSTNEFTRWTMAERIFKAQLDLGNSNLGADVDVILDNAAGVLDAVAAGQIVRNVYTGARAFRLARQSPIEATSHVNPQKTKEMIAVAVQDETGNVAKSLGTARSDLIESSMYPKPLDTISYQKMPADVRETIENIEQVADDIVQRTESFGFGFTDEVRETAEAAVQTRLEKTAGARYYSNLSEITSDSEVLKVRARFGFDENYGFPNGLAAQRKGRELFPESEIQILKRDKNGEYKPTKKLSGKGEYFFEIQESRAFDARDVLYFEPDSVNHQRLWGFLPTSPSAKFAPEVSNIGSILPGINKKVQRDMFSVLKDFKKLGVTSKNKVNQVLLDGYKEGKMFSYDDLVSKDLTNAEIKGYYSIKGLNDIQFIVENRRVFKDLKRQGMLSVEGKNGYKTIAAPVTESEAIVKAGTAYDPATRGVRSLDAAEIRQMYKEGDSIGLMYGTERQGEHITDYVVLSSKNGTRTSPLPVRVLNYDPGYITRVYKNKYFIEEKGTRIINGVRSPYTRVVNIAGTRKEAISFADDLNKTAEEGVRFNERVDRSMTQVELSKADKDMSINKGSLFTGKRSKHLTTQFGLAEVADPVEALLKTVGTVSRHASHTDVIQTMKQKWLNTYGGFFNHTYPSSPDTLKSALGKELRNDPAIKDAKAYWDYINLLDSVDTSGKLVDIRPKVIEFGEWVLGSGNSKMRQFAGNKIIDAANIDPMGKVRGLAFTTFLAGAPLRQAVVQSGQYLFLASIDPKFSTFVFSKNGLARQKIAMDLAMGAFTLEKNTLDKMLPGIAKVAGMTETEMREMVTSFRNSGLPFSIDSHMFVRDALQSYSRMMYRNNVTAFIGKTFTAPTKVIKAARTVGFDFGEYNNLATTWLFARNRFIKQNPGKSFTSRAAQDQIAADARQYSLTMTKEGSFGYQQRGFLSLITQFISIQHKALEAMTPVKLGGNRFLTASDKRRIAVGQLALWGTSGFGIREGYKAVRDQMGIETDENTDAIMQGGLAEFAYNKTLQTIYEDDTEVRIAESLAPASGILETNIMKAIVDLFSGGKSPLEYIPAVAAASRVQKAFEYSAFMMRSPHIETPEKLMNIFSSGMGVFSGYNNYLKARFAINAGYMASQTGNPIVEATHAEAVNLLFGFQSAETDDYYNVLLDKYRGPGKGTDNDLKDIAKTYYDNMTKHVTLFNDTKQGLDSIQTNIGLEAIKQESVILSVLDPLDREAVLEHFRSFVGRAIVDGSDKLITGITAAALGNQYGSAWEATLNKLKNSSLINTPEREQDMERLFKFMTEEEELATNRKEN